MCGIAGSYGGLAPEPAERMLDRLAHRGPAGAGQVEVAGNWLGHRRCPSADATGGAQPLTTDDGELFMVGDGVIYNEKALRATLSHSQFRTRSTTEAALHLFNERGPEAIADLRGMFAFIIAGKDGRFVVARDPVGIKPLYWARRDGQVLFASEIGTFDLEWLPLVEFFPPGHYWTPERGLVKFAEAVTVDPDHAQVAGSPPVPGADIPEQFLIRIRDELIETIEGQLVDNIEVGVFLSGGLDSSLVAAIAAPWYEQRGKALKTFAVGLDDSPDLHAARSVAAALGTEHHERHYTAKEAISVVPQVVRRLENFDPSLVRSSVPNYLLAEFAAKQVVSVMVGEGSDEIFGGYDYLEDFGDDEELQEELVRGLEESHSGGLQRVDRMTMAHGLQARLPFLEIDMIEVGFSIPAGWKQIGPGQPEKRLLRQAFDGWLPDDVLWRKKAQFGEGTGSMSVLQQAMAERVTQEEFERERNAVDPPLRTREELAYYRIFAAHLPGVRPERTISRFVTA